MLVCWLFAVTPVSTEATASIESARIAPRRSAATRLDRLYPKRISSPKPCRLQVRFDFFKGPSSCFRQAKVDEQEASQADRRVGPKGSRRIKRCVEQWERIRQQEARCPQRGDGNGHGTEI